MANIFDVAKYILRSVGGEISSMKLQKLCYYSQAWNLAWEEKPLFEEDFLKWDNGPVCRELFDIHQGMFYVNCGIVKDELLSPSGLSEEEKISIDSVIEDYGKYDGAELSELSHSEDPWRKTTKNAIIEKEDIHKYYYSLLPENEKDEYWMNVIKQKENESVVPADEVWRKIGLED